MFEEKYSKVFLKLNRGRERSITRTISFLFKIGLLPHILPAITCTRDIIKKSRFACFFGNLFEYRLGQNIIIIKRDCICPS